MGGRAATARLAAVLLAGGALAPGSVRAAGAAPSPAEIAARRQGTVADMLTDRYPADLIAGLRRVCAAGRAPASVAEDWHDGTYFTPAAADECVAALVRTARDGHLLDFYRDMLTQLGGDGDSYQRWPRLFGAGVMDSRTRVPIGRGKAAEVTPAMALDAGFTVAYQDGSAAKAGTADAGQLRTLAESCLGQNQDAGTCFSVGYLYGAQAFRQRAAAAN